MTTYQLESQYFTPGPATSYTAHAVSLKAVNYPIRISSLYAAGTAHYPTGSFGTTVGMNMNFYRVIGVTSQAGTAISTPAVREGSPAASTVCKFDTSAQGSPGTVGTSTQRITPQPAGTAGIWTWPSNLIILPGSALYMYGSYSTAVYGTPDHYEMYANFFFEELRLAWSF